MPGQGRAVARFLYRRYDRFRRNRRLIVCHNHRIAQKVYLHILHAFGMPYSLFHMRLAGRAGHPRYGKFLFHFALLTPPPWGVLLVYSNFLSFATPFFSFAKNPPAIPPPLQRKKTAFPVFFPHAYPLFQAAPLAHAKAYRNIPEASKASKCIGSSPQSAVIASSMAVPFCLSIAFFICFPCYAWLRLFPSSCP